MQVRSDSFSKLRDACRDIHLRLHLHPMTKELLSEKLTLKYYLKLLEAFYGFYLPLEEKLSLFQSVYPLISRAEWIRQDLQEHGYDRRDIDALPLCLELPCIDSPSAYLGHCYVIEGSSLGSQLIRKHLREHLNLLDANGARFFFGYGSDTSKRWKSFTAQLTGYHLTESESKTTVTSAQQTFLSLESWLWHCHRTKV